MALYVRRTVLITPKRQCTVKIVPQGGKPVKIEAPDDCDITDRKGRPLHYNRRKKPKST